MSSQGGTSAHRQQRGAQQRLTAARRATTQQATDGRDSRQMRAQTQRNARLRCSKPCIAHSLVLACVHVLVLAVVDVMQLPVADLQKLRQSLTEDVQTITQNYGNLKVASHTQHKGQGSGATAQTRGASRNRTLLRSRAHSPPDCFCCRSLPPLVRLLQLAHSKYGQALEALTDLTPENQDKRIMVPLTSSMYIPGTLSNIQSVLVDVGTGYFVSKPIADARVFIQSKMEMIAGNLSKVAGAMSGKRRDLDAVSSILQAKLQAQYQAQQNAMQKVESLQ